MTQLEDRASLLGREIHFGGIVTAVRRGLSKRGTPYGIVSIEDYEGTGELAPFGEDWAKWASYMETSNSLFIKGRVTPRKYQQDQLELRIESVQFLADVKENIVQSITISFWLEALDEETVFALADFARNNPGKTQIVFHVHESGKNTNLQVISTNYMINVTKDLLDFLDHKDSLTYKIN